ncbi:MAG: hypothetical protein C0606_06035 [Hyphomicrobiales bacterium]|nr:MAG: hypothetical protein C0606_06035 [Hyphomicrobiales bacterium]
MKTMAKLGFGGLLALALASFPGNETFAGSLSSWQVGPVQFQSDDGGIIPVTDPRVRPWQPQQPFRAFVCKSDVTEAATMNNETNARTFAIRDWEEKVRSQYGERYSHWSKARNKRIECRPKRPGEIYCRVTARPCG